MLTWRPCYGALLSSRPMFTGIVAGLARVQNVVDQPGLRTFHLSFPPGFAAGLALGASVAVEGVCLTVTRLHEAVGEVQGADFDVMQQSLALTTLGRWRAGDEVNVERAAKDGAEIGGHPLSGHVDCLGRIIQIQRPPNNHVLRVELPPAFRRYVFAKGYIAVNGCSLTAAEVNRAEGWFEVWLIPETLRLTTFGQRCEGDVLNIEIERQTQVFVDTVREAIEERLGPLLPALEQLLRERGLALESVAGPLPVLQR
jgi:riboflavin synthase